MYFHGGRVGYCVTYYCEFEAGAMQKLPGEGAWCICGADGPYASFVGSRARACKISSGMKDRANCGDRAISGVNSHLMQT